MVVLLGLAAAVLYGTGDFLGGVAARRAHVLVVLMLAETASVIVALPAAAMSPGPARLAGLAWGVSAGLVGGLGLIIFYTGLAAGPMSVVAPVSGLVSTVLPIAVALAEGERPGAAVYAGALLCLAAIVLASSATDSTPAGGASGAAPAGPPGPGRALGYGTVSGALFGLFFLLIRNAGQSGELWPVAAGRIGELVAVVIAAAVLRRSLLPRGAGGKLLEQAQVALLAPARILAQVQRVGLTGQAGITGQEPGQRQPLVAGKYRLGDGNRGGCGRCGGGHRVPPGSG